MSPPPPVAYRPFPSKRGRNWRQQHLEIPLFAWLLELPPQARVLEVGCGRGIGLPVIGERCRPERLVGIDFDADLLAEARGVRVDGTVRFELLEADVRTMPFEDESFDVVIDFGTCYHIDRPWEALQEISRVLQPEGIFAYETPLNQMLSHPVRAGGRRLPWMAAPDLVPSRRALLWETRRKRSDWVRPARAPYAPVGTGVKRRR